MTRRLWAVLLAVSCALPRMAYADDAVSARAHYETAQQLYDEGRYDEAITEFELAYREKPHPNVLYNIGQAHERLLDYRAAVEGFERYLSEAAPDDPRRKVVENRLRVLRNLPARVSVSTTPEHVNVVLHGKNGFIVSGESPHVFSVPAGDYELELTRDGWETERANVHAEIGQPYFYQYRLVRSTSDTIVESDPSGARVFIDDRLVGETPWHGALDVGKHGLLLEYPEYPWHREHLVVEPGKPGRRTVKLERPVRSGRTELVLGAMAFGGVVGPLLVGALSGSTHFTQTGPGLATLLLSSAAGIGAGFAGAFFTTRGGIPVGTSSLLIGGGAFGTGLGVSLALGLGSSDRTIYGITLAGGAVGLTTAALIAHYEHVSGGDAALVNSGGIWGTGAAALLVQSFDWGSSANRSPTRAENGWFLLGGTALGLTAGILSAKFLERTRTEVAVVDLSGLVGTGLGFALGYAVGISSHGDGRDRLSQGSRFGLGGMAIGLVSGVFISRNFAKRLFRPKQPGHAALDIPQLRIEQLTPQQGGGTRVSLDVLRGTW
ncbi:MAG: PEGA domain-containing protein [Polyangia bacterium]